MVMRKDLWYSECELCPFLDQKFKACNKALAKPKSIHGFCNIFAQVLDKVADS